jgi:DEAD/DEAH box helicase domain-containing protein
VIFPVEFMFLCEPAKIWNFNCSLWQQAGRSGRRAKQSFAIYVAFEGPLDQYFMKSPHKLFGRPIEHCQVDSHNPKVGP